MSKSRSQMRSTQQNNRDQSAGPMLEGAVSVATNHMFSGSGLRGHNPDVKPLFSQKKMFCLYSGKAPNAPSDWSCGITSSDS